MAANEPGQPQSAVELTSRNLPVPSSALAIGAISSLQAWTRIGVPYAWGWLADHTGRKVMLLRVAAALTLVFGSLLYFSAQASWLPLCVFLLYLFNGGVVPLSESALARYLRTDTGVDTGRYGQIRVWGSIGFIVSAAAGGLVLEALGMKVVFYDVVTKLPLGNAEAVESLKALVSKSDIITLHVPETNQTRNLINKNLIKYFKKGTIVINYARGEVVDLDALSKAIKDGLVSGAAIDVFPWEPEKNGDRFTSPMQHLPNVILTPHIGGSTEEAQQNIGVDVSAKMLHYLDEGVSIGSHTVPELSLPPVEGTHRILHIHNNVPGVLSEINTRLSENRINILAQYLKTNDSIGYVVLDVDKKLSGTAAKLLKEVRETIKVRLLY